MSSVAVILASVIASLMIFITIVLLVAHYTSAGLTDLWVEDSLLETIAYAALVAIAAIFFFLSSISKSSMVSHLSVSTSLAPLFLYSSRV